MKELKVANQEIVLQICDVIKQLTTDEYSEKLNILSGSSIGMHVRHILEFYSCFLRNVEQQKICYDNRERKLIFEVDPTSTIEEFSDISNKIGSLNENTELNLSFNPSQTTSEPQEIKSSVARELLYTMDHSIHHMALIKIAILYNFQHLSFPDSFGVAPSTLRHQKQCAQ